MTSGIRCACRAAIDCTYPNCEDGLNPQVKAQVKAKKATDPADLERKILDPNISKNEAEWWARERILELEKQHDRDVATLESWNVAITDLQQQLTNANRRIEYLELCDSEATQQITELKEANERKEHEAIYHGSIEMHSVDSTGNGPRIACVRTRESRQQSYLNGAPTGSLPSPLYPRTVQGPTFFSDNPDHYQQHADAGKEQS